MGRRPSILAVGKGVPVLLLASGVLAACSSSSNTDPALAEGRDRIPCAVGGAVAFKPVCAVERRRRNGRLTLIVHHPNGGFRRFDVQTDGSGLAASDGADPVVAHLADGKLDVKLGADRYIFPVTTKTHDQP